MLSGTIVVVVTKGRAQERGSHTQLTQREAVSAGNQEEASSSLKLQAPPTP